MNSVATNRSENKVSKFTQDLQDVNEDWPLLGELSQNKFVLKNKKSSFNVAKTAKEIVELSLVEDDQISASAIKEDKLFEQSFVRETQDFKASPQMAKSVVNDTFEPLAQVEKVKPPKPVIEAYIEHVQPADEELVAQKSLDLPQENKFTNTLLKLIAIGLTKLYVRKTTSVLNPVKFLAENYRRVLVAVMHLGVPILMSWFLITQVSFIQTQLVDISNVMFGAYAVVFYFASLFVWVTGQVLVAGLLSMFKTTLISVANDAENKE